MYSILKLFANITSLVMPKKFSGFYAVSVGRQCGIFNTWAECESQVKGFPNAAYKKFPTKSGAENFINSSNSSEIGTGQQKRKLTHNNSFTSKRPKVELNSDLSGKQTEESSLADGAVVVYTDGCCLGNGRNKSKAGLGVYWGRVDHPDNLSEKLVGRQSNNRAEIMAVVRAIGQAKDKKIGSLEIRTDSMFLINCVTKWMANWKKRDWKLANGGPVINREELEQLDEVQKGIEIKYVHVRGHQGVEGNEQADRLANEGALK